MSSAVQLQGIFWAINRLRFSPESTSVTVVASAVELLEEVAAEVELPLPRILAMEIWGDEEGEKEKEKENKMSWVWEVLEKGEEGSGGERSRGSAMSSNENEIQNNKKYLAISQLVSACSWVLLANYGLKWAQKPIGPRIL